MELANKKIVDLIRLMAPARIVEAQSLSHTFQETYGSKISVCVHKLTVIVETTDFQVTATMSRRLVKSYTGRRCYKCLAGLHGGRGI